MSTLCEKQQLRDLGEPHSPSYAVRTRITDAQQLQGPLRCRCWVVFLGGGGNGMGPNGNAPRAAEGLCAVEFGRRCAPGLGFHCVVGQAAFTAPTRTDSGQSQDLFRGGATVRPS